MVVALLIGAGLAACGCGGGSAPHPAHGERVREPAGPLEEAFGQLDLSELEADEVRFRLAFGPEADLDLFVTDSTLETVYYGNSPSESGGALSKDIRCGDSERIETVTFKSAVPGRFRVGIDFPKQCEGRRESTAFAIAVECRRDQEIYRGTITPGAFEPVVIEVNWP
jgi:hypothetical protein